MRKVTFSLCGLVLFAACGNTGSGGGSGGTPEQLIDQYCAKLASLSCGSTTAAACQAELSNTRADNVAGGCGAQFDAIMRCAAPQEITCDRDVDALCPAELAALDECRAAGNSECLIGVGTSTNPSCSVYCATYVAVCNPSSSGTFECSCTEGPRIGMTFTVSSCSTDFTSVAEANCL
jgi:hypothetical protein